MRSSRLGSLLVAMLFAAASGDAAAHGHGGGHRAPFFHGYGGFGASRLGYPFFQPAFGLSARSPGAFGAGITPMLRPAPPDERHILESESGLEAEIRGLEQPDASGPSGTAPHPAAPAAQGEWKPL